MNGTIASDLLDHLVDGKFKWIGKAPSLTEWKEERDRLEYALRMHAWSRVMGKQEAAYSAEPWDLITLFEQLIKQEAEKDRADFDYWSKISRWTPEEATALSFGKAPKVVNSDKVEAYNGQSSFADDYSKRLCLLLRAQETSSSSPPTLPLPNGQASSVTPRLPPRFSTG